MTNTRVENFERYGYKTIHLFGHWVSGEELERQESSMVRTDSFLPFALPASTRGIRYL